MVLSTLEIEPGLLREKLAAAGFPNLWIPKKLQRIGVIPILASGKLDLKKCKDLALAAAG